ncbi:MAG TPA: cytochrome P450 [Croceibacterium sp.]|nr:cytochrome P450 [Croceibacterium sp.]
MKSDFDPLAPETFDSPHEEYRRLRETCPVAHSDAWGGFWALTKHDDVVAAASDWRTFITSVQNVVPKVAFTGRRPPLHLDPPEHTPYRRALAPLLSERRVAALEPVIREICRELLHPLVARGGGDIVAEFSAPMPIATFANWMNLEADAIAELTRVGRDYNIAVQSNDLDETKRSSLLLYDMARALVDDRKASPLPPDEDATSALLAARIDGEPLPEEMIVGTIRQVLVVGIIAPSVTIGSMVVHLCRDHALQCRLRQAPSLIPATVEELLRLYTPYRGFARTAVRDVEIRGRTIRQGEPIAVVYASANRDADVFDDPDSFRLDRANIKDSVAFGRGPHACVGAALARLELRVALEELLAAAASFALAGEPVQTRFPEIGALSVPITFGNRA